MKALVPVVASGPAATGGQHRVHPDSLGQSGHGRPRVRLRLVFAPEVSFGPGKADLLQSIRERGSISAAGRSMQMSYKRAWQLVDELNRMFSEPLVDCARGGARGGGARLTEAGEQVLMLYRTAEDAAAVAGAAAIGALRERLRPKQRDR